MDIPRLKHTTQSFEMFHIVLRPILKGGRLRLGAIGVMAIRAFL